MNAILALANVVIKELYRRKDFYVLLFLTVLITLILALGNMFNDSHVTANLKEICLLLIWIAALVMAVATAARQIPAERENRTIFPLLAKPVTRAHVVAGKFLGCWFASGIALAVFYIFLAVISASIDHQWHLLNYLEAFWMQWMFLAVVNAMVLLGSILFPAPSSNATLCIILVFGILLLGSRLSSVAVSEPEPWRTIAYVVYFIIPHLEYLDLRDIVTNKIGLLHWPDIALTSLYAWAYTLFFLFAAWMFFRRKPLSV